MMYIFKKLGWVPVSVMEKEIEKVKETYMSEAQHWYDIVHKDKEAVDAARKEVNEWHWRYTQLRKEISANNEEK